MKTSSRKALLLGLLFMPVACSVEAASDNAPIEPQVIVTATRAKLVKLEKEILLAEQRFYAKYNEINTNRDYAVKCHNEAVTGSRFKQTTCQPVFANKAQEEQARRMVATLTSTATPDTNAAGRLSAGATTGIAGLAGSSATASAAASATSAVKGKPAVMTVGGIQPYFQKNMMEVTARSPELKKLLDEHAKLVKEYEDTARQLNEPAPKSDDDAAK